MIKRNHIYQGDVLTVLKTFPDKCIDCVITSPPYWALRDYEIEPVIWDGDENCEHQWGEKIIKNEGYSNKQKRWQDGYSRKTASEAWNTEISGGNFCQKCGAWRGSLGLEPSIDLFVKHLCDIFDEVKRILRKDGTCWVNLGDSYNNQSGTIGRKDKSKYDGKSDIHCLRGGTQKLQSKCLCQIPSRFAIEMCDRGWILRNEIIWQKLNCMPSSITDRFTVDFEKIFFFVKNQKYSFEQQFEPVKFESIQRSKREYGEGKNLKTAMKGTSEYGYHPENHLGRNKRTIWKINTHSFKEAHFAVFPEKLIETPIKAGCPELICEKCGKAQKKIFEIPYDETHPKFNEWRKQNKIGKYGGHHPNYKVKGGGQHQGYGGSVSKYYQDIWGGASSPKTQIGIEKCDCNAKFVPGIVLDPFMGAGTTGLVAKKLGRDYIGIELNKSYIKMAERRIKKYTDGNLLEYESKRNSK
jgi:site-specific DNA-methyltransferase (adenine-specific)